MDFKLVEAQTTNECDEDDYTSEDETYDDIHQNKKQPVMSTVQKKRENKTVECPNCHRKMNKKHINIVINARLQKHSQKKKKQNQSQTHKPQKQTYTTDF